MNQVLFQKIKSNINEHVLSLFVPTDFDTYTFVPIDIKNNNTLYVAICEKSKKDVIEKVVKEKLKVDTKFMSVEFDVFLALYSYVKELSNNKKTDKRTAGKKRLGELLIENGDLTEQELALALKYSKEKKMPIGSSLVQLGYVTVDELKNALEQQLGVETVNTEQLKIEKETLNLLPEEFVKSNMVLPLSSDGKTIVVGMVNPGEKRVLNEIVYLTGLQPQVRLITYSEFQSCLYAYYHTNEMQSEAKQIMQQVEDETAEAPSDTSLWEQVEKEIQDSTGSIAELANKIIKTGLDMRASDIHLEPRLAGFVVRYRIDGILQEVFKIPPKADQPVITRFKVLSRMDISEHRRPQDGTFTMKFNNQKYDFRINTLPVSNKEKMVIRILAPAVSLEKQSNKIELVGINENDLGTLKKLTTHPNGILLAAGPTGSGKTTTLYQILTSINDEKVNITTIEDPVEIKIDGVNQSQINPKAGITFASCMRSILRQDPDIILVGEIRDYETLETAISAALTGHLVLSTVHTNSAAATVTRLIEMGAKGYLVASTLNGVIAQRLVRRLCPHCKEKYQPTQEELDSIISRQNYADMDIKKLEFYKPVGCPHCNQEGYKGRLGVFEILPVTKEIKKLIAQGAHDLEIEEAAIANGMTTLAQSCLLHILNGETSVSEFIRVLGMAGD